MKILSVSFGITYISYMVEYKWLPDKLVIIRAETHKCLDRVIILKDEYQLEHKKLILTERFKKLNHRSWKEFKTNLSTW